MFKKPGGKQPADPLADRLRKIADRPPLESDAYQDAGASRKRAPRQTTFKQGTITLQGGERLDVVIKNLSSTGARVEFFRKVVLTEKVLLSEPSAHIRTWAQVMWQADGVAGLFFLTG